METSTITRHADSRNSRSFHPAGASDMAVAAAGKTLIVALLCRLPSHRLQRVLARDSEAER